MRLSMVPAILASVLLAIPALSAPNGRGSHKENTEIEYRELRQIYAAAREESGVLQVAWGGDGASTI
jgi:hypothetical protein